jgi:hypothetical protein
MIQWNVPRIGALLVLTMLGWGAALAGCSAMPGASSPAPTEASRVTTPPAPSAAALRVSGIREPESVLYDSARDRYLVSNINGNPFAADDNGFIAWVSPAGEVVQTRWEGVR